MPPDKIFQIMSCSVLVFPRATQENYLRNILLISYELIWLLRRTA